MSHKIQKARHSHMPSMRNALQTQSTFRAEVGREPHRLEVAWGVRRVPDGGRPPPRPGQLHRGAMGMPSAGTREDVRASRQLTQVHAQTSTPISKRQDRQTESQRGHRKQGHHPPARDRTGGQKAREDTGGEATGSQFGLANIYRAWNLRWDPLPFRPSRRS